MAVAKTISLTGGAGADTLRGGSQDDIITFGAGALVSVNGIDVFEIGDTLVDGGSNFDTLRGTEAGEYFDMANSVFAGKQENFENFELGGGDDIFVGESGAYVNQFFVDGGDGADRISAFGVKTSNKSLNHVDPSYDDVTGSWTINFTGQSGPQSVVLTQAQIQDTATWDPLQNSKTVFDNANFTSGSFFDGGAGTNTRVEGSNGTDVIFGGQADGLTDAWGL